MGCTNVWACEKRRTLGSQAISSSSRPTKNFLSPRFSHFIFWVLSLPMLTPSKDLCALDP